jgi:hypothetical protein
MLEEILTHFEFKGVLRWRRRPGAIGDDFQIVVVIDFPEMAPPGSDRARKRDAQRR